MTPPTGDQGPHLEQRTLEHEIGQRLEPEFAEFLGIFGPVADSRIVRGILRLVGVDPAEITAPLTDAKKLLSDAARGVLEFTQLGWAPSSQYPADAYTDALRSLDADQSIEEVESVIAAGWNTGDVILWRLNRVASLGKPDPVFSATARRRLRLLKKALDHHKNEAYEASVPIVLAQADGIVHDFGGVSLYSKRQPASPLQDDRTIAGMKEGLSALRDVFGAGVPNTVTTGGISRHGVMHGRELGYDTLINSTKAFVLLIAVVEWAQPIAAGLAEARRKAYEHRYAGSNEVDQQGRRLDNRGFAAAKESLRWLSTCQMGQWNNHGRYADDLEEMFPGEVGKRSLKGVKEIRMVTAADGSSFFAWQTTVSGWNFGIAGMDGPPNEYYYAGLSPPSGGPLEGEGWRDLFDDLPPDWEAS